MIKADFSTMYRLICSLQGNDDKYYMFTLPCGNRVMAIDHIIFILNDIEKVYFELVKNNKDILEEAGKFPSTISPNIYFPLYQRQLWLLGSYLVVSCNLEQIIYKEYDHIKQHFKEMTTVSYFSDRKDLSSRKQEIEKIKFLRNKIFAHTAFASPEGENADTLETSLHIFAGTMFSYSKEGIIVSGGKTNGPYCCTLDKVQEEKDGICFPSIEFSQLTIEIKNLIENWHKMFGKLMKQFEFTKDEIIISNMPAIKHIRRWKDGQEVSD